jgi:glucose-6-phosphate 1-dehydrogenase
MSLPPRAFPPTAAGLGEAGLHRSEGWTRLVVEKPFGKDLATAQELNRLLHEHFQERQIYRIDHYLGKETVQNLLVFRLSNAFIESSWNRERIEAVQITVGEDLGVGTRAEYYDHAGALRDMVQNHLTQLLTLVAMEVPTSFSADAIRNEKIKVLHSLRPLRDENVVRGRYTAGNVRGELVGGYLDEPGVPADSRTETFIAMKMFVDSWRWQGVPFYLRTGKCMPHKTTQIAVRFRAAPVSFFEQYGCTADTHDVLTITLQPNEGFAFYLDIKRPGSPLRLERIPLRFHYDEHFEGTMPDAYQTLLLDVLNGDQTLFVHAEEVEESWRVYTPLIESPPPVVDYAAGTWGPPEAESLAIPEKDLWQRSKV